MKNRKILLVEDELIIGMNIKGILENLGYPVVTVLTTGEEAVDFVHRETPDIVLMDIILAGSMTGIEAAKRIREFCDVPILYLTANVDDHTLDQARDTMPSGYINKPADRLDLQSSIDTAIYRYETEKKARESDRRFRELFKNVKSGVIIFKRSVTGGEFVFDSMNISAERILNLSSAQMQGHNLFSFFPESRENRLHSLFSELKETGRPASVSAVPYSIGGIDLWIDINAYILDDGELVTVFDDVTEREIMIDELNRRNRELDGMNIRLNAVNSELESLNEELQASLEEMEAAAEELAVSNSRLAQSEEMYRSLFMNAPVGIFHYDRDLRITELNNSFVEILRTTRSALMDLDMNLLKDQRVMPALKKPLNGEYGYYEGEYKTTNRGISIRTQIKTVPSFDEFKNINGAIGMVLDVTETWEREQELIRKEADLERLLEEKEIYIKEIHHRVKNNLQVVTSLIGLQAMSCSNEETLEQLKLAQNRIGAMALIQEKIYISGNLAEVDFAKYLRTLSLELFNSYSSRLKNTELRFADLPVTLTVNQAVPLAIIANELITNAFKHAFPDNAAEKGYVLIRLGEKEDMVEFAVEDNGIGISETIDPGSTATLGFALVSLEARQLRGGVSVERNDTTRISVRFRKSCG